MQPRNQRTQTSSPQGADDESASQAAENLTEEEIETLGEASGIPNVDFARPYKEFEKMHPGINEEKWKKQRRQLGLISRTNVGNVSDVPREDFAYSYKEFLRMHPDITQSQWATQRQKYRLTSRASVGEGRKAKNKKKQEHNVTSKANVGNVSSIPKVDFARPFDEFKKMHPKITISQWETQRRKYVLTSKRNTVKASDIPSADFARPFDEFKEMHPEITSSQWIKQRKKLGLMRKKKAREASSISSADSDIPFKEVQWQIPLNLQLSSSPSTSSVSQGPEAGSSRALSLVSATAPDVTAALPVGLLPIAAQRALTRALADLNVQLPFSVTTEENQAGQRDRVERWQDVSGFNDCALQVLFRLDPSVQEAYRNREADPQTWANCLWTMVGHLARTRDTAQRRMEYGSIDIEHLRAVMQLRGLTSVNPVEVQVGNVTVSELLTNARHFNQSVLVATGPEGARIAGHGIAPMHYVLLEPSEAGWNLSDSNPGGAGPRIISNVTTSEVEDGLTRRQTQIMLVNSQQSTQVPALDISLDFEFLQHNPDAMSAVDRQTADMSTAAPGTLAATQATASSAGAASSNPLEFRSTGEGDWQAGSSTGPDTAHSEQYGFDPLSGSTSSGARPSMSKRSRSQELVDTRRTKRGRSAGQPAQASSTGLSVRGIGVAREEDMQTHVGSLEGSLSGAVPPNPLGRYMSTEENIELAFGEVTAGDILRARRLSALYSMLSAGPEPTIDEPGGGQADSHDSSAQQQYPRGHYIVPYVRGFHQLWNGEQIIGGKKIGTVPFIDEAHVDLDQLPTRQDGLRIIPVRIENGFLTPAITLPRKSMAPSSHMSTIPSTSSIPYLPHHSRPHRSLPASTVSGPSYPPDFTNNVSEQHGRFYPFAGSNSSSVSHLINTPGLAANLPIPEIHAPYRGSETSMESSQAELGVYEIGSTHPQATLSPQIDPVLPAGAGLQAVIPASSPTYPSLGGQLPLQQGTLPSLSRPPSAPTRTIDSPTVSPSSRGTYRATAPQLYSSPPDGLSSQSESSTNISEASRYQGETGFPHPHPYLSAASEPYRLVAASWEGQRGRSSGSSVRERGSDDRGRGR